MLSQKQLNILNLYSNFNNLAIEQPEIYYLIRKHKIEPFFSKVIISRIAKNLWTKEIVTKCAKICVNRSEFKKYFESASIVARKDGYYEELMKNKPFWKDNFTKYTLHKILEIAQSKKIRNYTHFRVKHPSPYQQSYQQGWLDIIKKFIEEKQYNSKIDIEIFLIKNKKLIQKIKPRNLNKKIKIRDKKYSDKYLIQMAKQFSNAKSFLNAHPLLYKTLLRRGLTQKVFTTPIHQRYSNEDLLEIAAKYSSKAEFAQKESGAFWSIKNRGLLSQACSHMKKLEDSLGEILVRKVFNYYFNKSFYKIRPTWLRNPKTKKFLELDGYNHELNIAFEVNGAYHFQKRINKRKETLKITQYKDRYKIKTCRKNGVKLYVFDYRKGNLDSLCQQLHELFQIPMNILQKIKLEVLPSLNHSEINILKRQYKIHSKFKIKEIPFEEQCSLLNNLRKENLSNHKICQVLNMSTNQLESIIKTINTKGLNLIRR